MHFPISFFLAYSKDLLAGLLEEPLISGGSSRIVILWLDLFLSVPFFIFSILNRPTIFHLHESKMFLIWEE